MAIHELMYTLTSSSLLGCRPSFHRRVGLIRGHQEMGMESEMRNAGRANLARNTLATGVGAGSWSREDSRWHPQEQPVPWAFLIS